MWCPTFSGEEQNSRAKWLRIPLGTLTRKDRASNELFGKAAPGDPPTTREMISSIPPHRSDMATPLVIKSKRGPIGRSHPQRLASSAAYLVNDCQQVRKPSQVEAQERLRRRSKKGWRNFLEGSLGVESGQPQLVRQERYRVSVLDHYAVSDQPVS